MSPGAAAIAVDWGLRELYHKKKQLVIVTGKTQTYTYDFNQLRHAVEGLLKELSVDWQ
jgi:hypothetical protein